MLVGSFDDTCDWNRFLFAAHYKKRHLSNHAAAKLPIKFHYHRQAFWLIIDFCPRVSQLVTAYWWLYSFSTVSGNILSVYWSYLLKFLSEYCFKLCFTWETLVTSLSACSTSGEGEILLESINPFVSVVGWETFIAILKKEQLACEKRASRL